MNFLMPVLAVLLIMNGIALFMLTTLKIAEILARTKQEKRQSQTEALIFGLQDWEELPERKTFFQQKLDELYTARGGSDE